MALGLEFRSRICYYYRPTGGGYIQAEQGNHEENLGLIEAARALRDHSVDTKQWHVGSDPVTRQVKLTATEEILDVVEQGLMMRNLKRTDLLKP